MRPKNLVFLADGTGNDSDIAGATNVYRLYQRLRSDVPGHQRLAPAAVETHLRHLETAGIDSQITQYDAGVGTARFDIIGKATGKGISQNIKDGYEFFTRFYQPGDRLYLFGFSRGAYTVRSLAGMIGICGLPRRKQGGGVDLLFDAPARGGLVERAYAIYKTAPGPEGAAERERLGSAFVEAHGHLEHRAAANRAVYMIGVWDTVRSLGIPTRWGDWELPGNKHRFHDHDLSPHILYAFHALSIDDRRLQFHPTIWNEPTKAQRAATPANPNKQTFAQVWFPGVHSDVGGGYPDETGLADATLKWMIRRVQSASHPPKFYGAYETDPTLGIDPRPGGRLHDSRDTWFKKTLYQEQPRTVSRGQQASGRREIVPAGDPANIHMVWLDRLIEFFKEGRFGYDPENVREHPDVTTGRMQCGQPARPLPGPFKWFVKD